MRLRLVQPEDAEAIREIYNHEVVSGTNTFDLVTRTADEQRRWVERHRGAHPAIVAVDGGGSGEGEGEGESEGFGGGPDEGLGGSPGADLPGGLPEDPPGDSPDTVMGFAVVSPFRDRAAYATTVESSVYVHADHRRKGIGKALVDELLTLTAAHGFHTVVARICTENVASIRLHRDCGYEIVGTEHEVGRKHGRWLDVVELQRIL